MKSHPAVQAKRLDRRFAHNKKYGFTIYLEFEEYPEWKVIDQIQNMLTITYGDQGYSPAAKQKCGWDGGYVTKKGKPPQYRIVLRDESMLAYVIMIL